MDMSPWKNARENTVVYSLKNEFNKLFDRFWSGQFEPLQIGRWVPALDVSETGEAVLVRVELPGIDPKDIDISIEGDVLSIKGEKHEERRENEQEYFRVERQYGSFVRHVQLPSPVVVDKVEAVARHGVLEIRLPKSEEHRTKKVTITVA
jgi:HSP20 family protein